MYACATHAVFSPPAVDRLSSGVFQEVIVANTIPIPPEHQFPELTVLSGEDGGGGGGVRWLAGWRPPSWARAAPALFLASEASHDLACCWAAALGAVC